mmetsp:Transcript_9602/g.33755  ORF Transcript_9602/g.33755 Transcript_9602/m.33755 type:complete len:330 (+) Transcript_9602:321-1310(+)
MPVRTSVPVPGTSHRSCNGAEHGGLLFSSDGPIHRSTCDRVAERRNGVSHGSSPRAHVILRRRIGDNVRTVCFGLVQIRPQLSFHCSLCRCTSTDGVAEPRCLTSAHPRHTLLRNLNARCANGTHRSVILGPVEDRFEELAALFVQVRRALRHQRKFRTAVINCPSTTRAATCKPSAPFSRPASSSAARDTLSHLAKYLNGNLCSKRICSREGEVEPHRRAMLHCQHGQQLAPKKIRCRRRINSAFGVSCATPQQHRLADVNDALCGRLVTPFPRRPRLARRSCESECASVQRLRRFHCRTSHDDRRCGVGDGARTCCGGCVVRLNSLA